MAELSKHPTEVARMALRAAATFEDPAWARVLRRFAAALPDRDDVDYDELTGRECPSEQPTAEGLAVEEYRARCEAWRALPAVAREHAVLNALADDCVTVSEIRARISEQARYVAFGLDVTLRALVRSGDVQRAAERYRSGRVRRYQYFRAPADPAEIARLDAALRAIQ